MNWAPSACWERRENSVFLDFLVILEDKDPRDLSALLGSPGQTERREPGVLEARRGPAVRGDQRGPGDSEGRGGPLENQELKERQEATGPTDPQERGVCQDPRVPTASQDPKDLPDLLGRTDFLDTRDSEEKWVSKAKLDHQAPLESSALRAHQERRDHWESEGTLGPQDPLESRVYLVLRGRRAPRETPDPRGAPARTDPQD